MQHPVMRGLLLAGASLALLGGAAQAQSTQAGETLVAQLAPGASPVTPEQRRAPPAGYQAPVTPGSASSSAPMGQPGPAPVSQPGDPKQWHKEDRTPAEKQQTARKEAAAAYNEALKDCKTRPQGERASCNQEARTQFNSDTAAIGGK